MFMPCKVCFLPEQVKQLGLDGAANVGIEDFEKISEALALGFLTERMKSFERGEITLEIIIERDAIEPEVCASGAPRNGICWASKPALSRKRSAVMWAAAPACIGPSWKRGSRSRPASRSG